MRYIAKNQKLAPFALIAIGILISCQNKSTTKESADLGNESKTVSSAHSALAHAEGGLFRPSLAGKYVDQRCDKGPYIPPENFHEAMLGQTAWRTEIGSLKNEILAEINQIGLTQENAIKLALINNPELFAYYENLEVAYADFLEAGLRENPVFKTTTRVSDESDFKVNKEIETTTNFLDYFLVPFRQNAEMADLRVIEAEIKQKVIDLIERVQINWLTVKSLEFVIDQEILRVELKELAAGLSEQQSKVGNVHALEARTRQIEFQKALGRLYSLDAELSSASEEMHRALGLFGSETCFHFSGEIDWRSDGILPPITSLENAAIANRPDVEVIRREIIALAEEAKLKDPWTYAKLQIGESFEQELDGERSKGPQIELEMPIFNNGQAQRKKYYALINQAQKELIAKAVQACSEVRDFHKTAHIYQSQLEDLEINILPKWQTQIAEAMTHYNVMTLGVFELFDIKNGEIDATIEHIHALKNYLMARIKLLHALGGSPLITGSEV